jgi:hypothetical protein
MHDRAQGALKNCKWFEAHLQRLDNLVLVAADEVQLRIIREVFCEVGDGFPVALPLEVVVHVDVGVDRALKHLLHLPACKNTMFGICAVQLIRLKTK